MRNKQIEPPSALCCPMTLQLFDDPVQADDEHTYEREQLEAWLEKHDTSPNTGEVLPNKNFAPTTRCARRWRSGRRTTGLRLRRDGRPRREAIEPSIEHAKVYCTGRTAVLYFIAACPMVLSVVLF